MAPAIPGRRLAANGLTFWVERAGSGAPLLLITGLGYASWCWRELRAALPASVETIAFDNRGTGRTDKPAGPYSIELLAADAAAVLAACGIAQAHVLGHSMGGYIALTLALRRPAQVRSLLLVGTSPGGPDSAPIPPETLAAWEAARSRPAAEYARHTMPHSFAPGWTDAHPAEFEAILARRLEYPTPPANWAAQYDAAAAYVAQGIDVAPIAQPATVIHGRLDRVVPHSNGRLLASRLPRARFVDLPDAGHLPFLENPPRFAQLVREHLDAHGP